MKPRHSFIVGKFYPPHAGHHLLVRTAARTSERVTVAVLASSVETIPLATRVAWMREVHAADHNVTIEGAIDDVRVDYDDPAIWDAHMAIMFDVARRASAIPVDCVFSSERYGAELARRFNARSVCLDVERILAPISGTSVRRDPAAAWPFLAPPVRAWFAKRVVLIGAESTGKSTLALELAAALNQRGGAFAGTLAVPEHGRDYALLRLAELYANAALRGDPRPPIDAIAWRSGDFTAIAREQQRLEDDAAGRGGPVLIADTDAFATSVWHERYLGARSLEVEAIAAAHRPPLYLLTHHDDVPFAQDGTRDGEKIRAWMTARFVERLKESGRRFVFLRGDRDLRRRVAIQAIDTLLAEGWSLADPLG